jgi:hypothetical protein
LIRQAQKAAEKIGTVISYNSMLVNNELVFQGNPKNAERPNRRCKICTFYG